MKNPFIEHPRSVNETYTQHAVFAFTTAIQLLKLAAAAGVHAIFPWLFKSTVSINIIIMAAQFEKRLKS